MITTALKAKKHYTLCFWRYVKYIVKHKWFVLVAGRKLKVPLWSLVWHDWTKFLPCEWFPYLRFFYVDGPSTKTGGIAKRATSEFELAWNHHQKWNKHHWQYWIRYGDDGSVKVLPMAENALREMVADWIGAGRVVGKPDTQAWYLKNKDKMRLHPITRYKVETLLGLHERIE